jgi:5,10-methylenetetrahydrofolate reductase
MTEEQLKFPASLSKRPLIFTVVPLRDNKTGDPIHDGNLEKKVQTKINDVGNALIPINRITAVNVPELVEENHEGKPRYNSIYTRRMARGIADKIGKDAIINKVVAHLETYDDFVNWIIETDSLGIGNMVFVGGNTRHHRYPGPGVSDANLMADHLRKKLNLRDLTIGNICLPERPGEAKRMLFKTISGAKFFTTQMIFESNHSVALLDEYEKLCESAGISPATIILSFAPLKSTADLNLLDFLGVDLPDNIKEYILESEGISGTYKRSIKNALMVYGDILEHIEKGKHTINIGVNIEQLTRSNLPHSIEMLGRFTELIDLKSSDLSNFSF